jgi:hypothetical protein
MRNTITLAALAALLMVGSAHAALSDCPAIADIKAEKFTSSDPQLPAPYNEGFKYQASTASGKQWQGVALATTDSFLEEKYALKAEAVDEKDGKTVCSYGGKTFTDKDGTKSIPYLKMTLQK